jgi:hypothetical protein
LHLVCCLSRSSCFRDYRRLTNLRFELAAFTLEDRNTKELLLRGRQNHIGKKFPGAAKQFVSDKTDPLMYGGRDHRRGNKVSSWVASLWIGASYFLLMRRRRRSPTERAKGASPPSSQMQPISGGEPSTSAE